MKISTFSFLIGFFFIAIINPQSVVAAAAFSQVVILQPGWNIISTPRVLESYEFSVAETSANFDIFVLDASKPTGWATMADLGQSKFTPLYGYFVRNKTSVDQTLIFKYKADVPPNERLFQRTFTATGWYSFGAANPSYTKMRGGSTSDSNNIDPILNSLLGQFSYYATVVDFTDASSTADITSVALSDPWKVVVRSTDVSNVNEISKLNDLREIKGYAIYIKQTNALYSGSQNNDVPPSASLNVSIASTPVAQTVVVGTQNFIFSKIKLDSTNSVQSSIVKSIPMTLTVATGAMNTQITNCTIWDGATILTTGANVVNPVVGSTVYIFILDKGLFLDAGTSKALNLSCNLVVNATIGGVFQWGISTANVAAIVSTDLNSGASIVPSGINAVGNMMTVGADPTTLDPSSPAVSIFAAGSSNMTVSVFRLSSNVDSIGLFLSRGLASSSPANIVKATLWDGVTKIGEAVFPGITIDATAAISNFSVPQGGYKLVTVKIDSALIGVGQPAIPGQQIAVDYKNGDTATFTASQGLIIQRSYPVVTALPLPSNVLPNGVRVLARFKVNANATGDIGLHKLTMTFSTTTASVKDVNLYAYNDANFSQPASTGNADGAYLASNRSGISGGEEEFIPANGILQIPAGGSRYFELRGTVAGSAAGASVQVNLVGDTAEYPRPTGIFMSNAATVNADVSNSNQNNFVWSPNSTTTSDLNANDWTNGFGLGLQSILNIGSLAL